MKKCMGVNNYKFILYAGASSSDFLYLWFYPLKYWYQEIKSNRKRAIGKELSEKISLRQD